MSKRPADKPRPARRWVRRRHRVVFAILRPFFRLFLRLKYGFHAAPSRLKRAPYLIFCNHQSLLDMFMVAESFRFPLYYFASEDLFNLGWKTRAIRYLVAPIPKAKNVNDLRAVLDARKIVGEGGAVCVFVEGNRTFSGEQGYIDLASAKFAKMLKTPLVLYTFRGGYGVDPRWGGKARRGRIDGGVKRILTPEEISATPLRDLQALIAATLRVEEVPPAVPVRSRRRAEYLERVLYYCPACGAYESLVSEGNELICVRCGLTVRYECDLTFSTVRGALPCRTVAEWRTLEIAALRARGIERETGVIFSDPDVRATRTEGIRRVPVTRGKLTLDAQTFRIGGRVFPLAEVTAVTAQGTHEILIYHKGLTYQLTGGARFSPVKFTHAFYLLRQAREGKADDYLGGV